MSPNAGSSGAFPLPGQCYPDGPVQAPAAGQVKGPYSPPPILLRQRSGLPGGAPTPTRSPRDVGGQRQGLGARAGARAPSCCQQQEKPLPWTVFQKRKDPRGTFGCCPGSSGKGCRMRAPPSPGQRVLGQECGEEADSRGASSVIFQVQERSSHPIC